MAFDIYTDDGQLHRNVPKIQAYKDQQKTQVADFIASNEVPDEPTGTVNITANGTHNVAGKKYAAVNVPGIVPEGSLQITSNGTHDVTNYKYVVANIPSGGNASITATYSGGNVEAGTSFNSLKSNLAVKMVLPDSSQISVASSDYTLTGTTSAIVEGSNTITVSYGGMTTSFTVTGYAIHAHTATFKADGVTVGTVTFEEGQTSIDEPAVPTKNHYTGAWESYTLGTTDITINAVYTAIQYTITFRDDGGNHPQNYTEPTAGSVTAPTPTPRTNYTVAWPSWSVAYNNSQVVEAVYTEIVAAGVSMNVIRPGTTKSGRITIEPNSSVTRYSSHLPVTETKSLAFDVSNFTGVAGNGCPTHCKITALSTPSANTLKNSEFDITNDGGTITATNVTGTGMYSVEYVPVGTTNYPYGGLGLYPRAQIDGGIEYKIELSW